MKIIVYILLILITYGGIASANSGNWGTGATLLITTVAPFYPTYSAGESTSESTEDIARWFGDLDEKFACLSKIKISDVTFFA
ncbi:MAG: hypothetical protein LBV04_03020, partial [Deferribacteraceae bacterium]|nr:hypothetical protein [Deferribacteraceae bacterium]